MLIPSMTNFEINQEIDRDYEIITASTTLWRQMEEYHRERKKRKIRREEDFTVFREFKTKSKNRWITRLLKSPKVHRYSGQDDIITSLFTYYYSDIGLRFFFRTDSGLKAVFNGHMFTRYRERMQLPVTDTMDVAKLFFKNNREWNYQVMERKNEEQKLIGIFREGFVPGNVYIENEDFIWFIHKTFISKGTANLRMTSTADELIDTMRNNLVKAENQDEETIYNDLLRLYNDFGLMEELKYKDDIQSRMKAIVEEVKKNDMPETEFWLIN